MSLKHKILFISMGLLGVFYLGRYTAQKPKVESETSKSVDSNTKKTSNKHKVTVITKDCKTGQEVTTITEDENSITDKNKSSTTTSSEVITPIKPSFLNVSALVGTSVHTIGIPTYGISVTKQLLGPVTIGAYGMTDGVIGLSLGWNF